MGMGKIGSPPPNSSEYKVKIPFLDSKRIKGFCTGCFLGFYSLTCDLLSCFKCFNVLCHNLAPDNAFYFKLQDVKNNKKFFVVAKFGVILSLFDACVTKSAPALGVKT